MLTRRCRLTWAKILLHIVAKDKKYNSVAGAPLVQLYLWQLLHPSGRLHQLKCEDMRSKAFRDKFNLILVANEGCGR